jgi:shikimate kinase
MKNPSQAPLLVLTGFMGAGKTTLGDMLSRRLGWPLFDLDAEISRIHGPIPQLFAERGESGFRAIEHYQLETLLPTLPRPAILSLGGGAFVEPSNRALLERFSATVVFLDAPFDVLYARIAPSAAERPLVAGSAAGSATNGSTGSAATEPGAERERLRLLYQRRRPSYLLAHHQLDTSAAQPVEVLASLVHIAHSLAAKAPARDTL